MKVASFLRCGAVIVLSLVAGRAGAQLDSNAKVTLVFPPMSDECSMAITHRDTFDTTTYTSSAESLRAFLSCNGFFRDEGGDTVGFDSGSRSGTWYKSFAFIVDTIHKCFRNLTFYEQLRDNSPCFGFGYQGSTSDQFTVGLDSLPYEDSSGILRAHGTFSFSYQNTGSEDCYSVHQMLSGSCMDSGHWIDSITIEIVPNGYLAIVDQGSESLLATFSSSANPRTLEIYDLLGRNTAIVPIPSSAEFTELPATSLPPGCYFGRLGDQVAKFVVPPK